MILFSTGVHKDETECGVLSRFVPDSGSDNSESIHSGQSLNHQKGFSTESEGNIRVMVFCLVTVEQVDTPLHIPSPNLLCKPHTLTCVYTVHKKAICQNNEKKCGHTVTLVVLWWGTQLLDRSTVCLGFQQCITVLCRAHCRRVLGTWRGSPQVPPTANTSLPSPRLPPNVFHISGQRHPESRFLCFPHFYFWIWSSGATLRIRALGFGQMLMVLSRVTQPTTPPSLRPNCLKLNILGPRPACPDLAF